MLSHMIPVLESDIGVVPGVRRCPVGCSPGDVAQTVTEGYS